MKLNENPAGAKRRNRHLRRVEDAVCPGINPRLVKPEMALLNPQCLGAKSGHAGKFFAA